MQPSLRPVLLVLAALSGAWPLALWAQDQTEDRYQVEVIVFARPELRTSYYRWPGEPDTGSAIDFEPVAADDPATPPGTVFGDAASRRFPDPVAPAQPSPLTPAGPVFEPLEPEAWWLAEDWRRLAEARDYQPLVHLAWRQPAASFGEPQPVRVHGGGVIEHRSVDASRLLFGVEQRIEPIEAIDGTVALERGRFLHLRVDLALHTPARGGHGHPLDPITLEHGGSYFTFRLTERRQIQTGIVNYFDHERFGLIALVEKWEPPGQEPVLR